MRSGQKFYRRYHFSLEPGDCWGKLVALYRRRGRGGAWEHWGLTCDRCHAAWRDESLSAPPATESAPPATDGDPLD